MSAKGNVVEATLKEVLKEAGFTKSAGHRWVKINADSTILIELQRSQWAKEFYINFGVFDHPKQEPPSRPRFVDAHLGGRIQALHPNRSASYLSRALNLQGSKITDEARASAIRRWLNLSLPLIDALRNLKSLRSHPRKIEEMRSNGIFYTLDEAT
jgi:hypothetical protein